MAIIDDLRAARVHAEAGALTASARYLRTAEEKLAAHGSTSTLHADVAALANVVDPAVEHALQSEQSLERQRARERRVIAAADRYISGPSSSSTSDDSEVGSRASNSLSS